MLKNPIFDGIRQLESEKPAPNKIVMALDEEGVFDYSKSRDTKYKRDDYVNMLYHEIECLRSKASNYIH